ncbi:MAG: metallopeptidase TldD-related protein [Candidatus Bruticola sp.]
MASYANQLLVKALGMARDAEVSEEVYTEVNLAQPDQRIFKPGLGLRINIDGRLGYVWSEGEFSISDLLQKAAQSAANGKRGSFSQKGLISPTSVSNISETSQQLEDSIMHFKALIQGLDFMLPSLLPNRRFSLSARLLQHTLKITTRSGERCASRILHLLTLNSNDGIPVGDAIYSTSAQHSPAEMLCRLTWRSVHSTEMAWPDSNTIPGVFTSSACGKLLEDFAKEMLYADAPLFKSLPKNSPWLSPCINITDDASLPRGFGSVPFDGEGITKTSLPLIRQGELVGGIYDLSTARACGVVPNGSAVRPWGQPPKPGHSNLILKGGDYSLGELCAKTDFGILLDRLTPLPSHLKKEGQFARRCETAFLLHHGRPICRVPQFIVRANYTDLLGADLIGLGYESVLNGRTMCVPLAVRSLTLEEADIDPAETWSDYPELWW